MKAFWRYLTILALSVMFFAACKSTQVLQGSNGVSLPVGVWKGMAYQYGYGYYDVTVINRGEKSPYNGTNLMGAMLLEVHYMGLNCRGLLYEVMQRLEIDALAFLEVIIEDKEDQCTQHGHLELKPTANGEQLVYRYYYPDRNTLLAKGVLILEKQ